MFFEYQGNIYAGECPECSGAFYQTAWWVKVNLSSKSGWVLINEQDSGIFRTSILISSPIEVVITSGGINALAVYQGL